MTWSYSGDPSSSNLDTVRFLIGDTDTTDQLLQNAEINWALSNQGSVFAAAALCCSAIVSSGRLTDKFVGDLRIYASQRAQQYRDLAAEFTRQLAVGALPYAGGISVADKKALIADTDRVAPAFRIGMTDNPRNSTSASTST